VDDGILKNEKNCFAAGAEIEAHIGIVFYRDGN